MDPAGCAWLSEERVVEEGTVKGVRAERISKRIVDVYLSFSSSFFLLFLSMAATLFFGALHWLSSVRTLFQPDPPHHQQKQRYRQNRSLPSHTSSSTIALMEPTPRRQLPSLWVCEGCEVPFEALSRGSEVLNPHENQFDIILGSTRTANGGSLTVSSLSLSCHIYNPLSSIHLLCMK